MNRGAVMLTYVVSDMFKSPARVLVNTVNTVGVMGKGIAKDFKKIYPEMFAQYQKLCEKNLFQVGQLWLYKTENKWILNFPTKRHWRSKSKIEDIELGLQKFVDTYAEKGITSISFPMLGCGNGGLDWEKEVRPLMEYYLKNLPIDIYIHLYRKDPFETEYRNINEIKKWLRNEPESLAFIEVWEDIQVLLDKQNTFTTIDQHIEFKAEMIDQPEEGIKISSQGSDFYIYKTQFIDLWQHIRSLGFAIVSSMPHGLERYAPYVISVLRCLPYLKPVLISNNYETMQEDSIGLQFIPGIQNDLFPDIHEVNINE
jgi:O-acetyl-ADP-ribose deacetylase (regulator of RNase III)